MSRLIRIAWMPIFVFTMMLPWQGHAQDQSSCNSSNLADYEADLQKYKADLSADLLSHLKNDFSYKADLTIYLAKLNQVRKCEANAGKAVLQCDPQTIMSRFSINEYVKFQRNFWIVEKNGNCVDYPDEISYLFRNAMGYQMVSRLNDHWMLNQGIICKAKDGIKTERSFMLVDGRNDSRSQFFVLDFGVPMENYKTSQFWALTYPIGKGENLDWNIDNEDFNFRWSNGAEIKVDMKSGLILHNNLFDQASLADGCFTDNNSKPSSSRNYWPKLDMLTEGKKYLGSAPEFVKSSQMDASSR